MAENASTEGRGGATAASLRIDRSPPPRRRRGGAGTWVLGLLVLGVAGAAFWAFLGKATGALGGASVREGRAVRLSPEAGAERTTASGYVVARTRAAISPKYPGKLVRLLVDVGDVVEEGQLLAELDHAELDAAADRGRAEVERARSEVDVAGKAAAERKAAEEGAGSALESSRAALREAEARRDESRREAERQERLLEGKVATASERDRAAAQAKIDAAAVDRAAAAVESAGTERERASRDAATAEARVASARAALAASEASLREAVSRREDAFIRANFRGRVILKEAEVGEVIAPATTGGGSTRGALLTLADFDTLEMEVDVFERDVSLVGEGAPCRIVLDAYPKSPFPGKVRQVVPTADRQKATVQVKVAFDGADPRVLPGMGGKVVFLEAGTKVSGEAERVLLPASAVIEREGRTGVWLLEKEGQGTRVRFLPVRVGAREGESLTALSGLSGGERVVLDPPSGLEDGALVSPGAP